MAATSQPCQHGGPLRALAIAALSATVPAAVSDPTTGVGQRPMQHPQAEGMGGPDGLSVLRRCKPRGGGGGGDCNWS